MQRRRRSLSRLSFALLAYFAGTLTSAVTAVFGAVSWQIIVPTLIAAAVVHSAYRADRSTARLARTLRAGRRRRGSQVVADSTVSGSITQVQDVRQYP